MHLRDWLAVAGFSYGIVSDLIGASKGVQENTLAGFVLARIKRVTKGAATAPCLPAAVSYPYGRLIELAHKQKEALQASPSVESVSAALMGDHIVLTVTKKANNEVG